MSEFDPSKDLAFSPKNGFDRLSEVEIEAADRYARDYKAFLDAGKSERDAISWAVRLAEFHGFKPYRHGEQYAPGDRVYVNNRGKALYMAVIGREKLSEGFRMAAAHIDAPHLHIKPHPLFEDSELGYLKTHYYGMVRKYQWLAIPLELRGVFVLKDGTVRRVAIGQDPGDPLFTMTDLLPHLAQSQEEKPLGKAIEGEQLNLLIGSCPLSGTEGAERVKRSLLKLFYEKYGVTEEDFLSAELDIVPAFNACDIGLDRSMIGAFGHDDRVCSYAALTALLETKSPLKTAVAVLIDKEEIGSKGVTSMQSAAFDHFMEDLCEMQGVALRACFDKGFCLSCDVCVAYDPAFPDVFEKRNAAYLNYGPGVAKYLGSKGKFGTSDASGEVIAYLRRTFDANGVIWQLMEMGKVDTGGGGTIAQFIVNRNIDTVDIGVPVLSMHSPFEVVSKLDLYMLHKAVAAVFVSEE